MIERYYNLDVEMNFGTNRHKKSQVKNYLTFVTPTGFKPVTF